MRTNDQSVGNTEITGSRSQGRTANTALPYLVLGGGVLVVSTAALLITLAKDAGTPSLTIAAGRLLIAAIILTPLTWSRHATALRTMHRRDGVWSLLAGCFLAIHFASWITSLQYTSVASSTALVATNPIFVGLASVLVFHERLHWAAIGGIVLSVIGSALIGWSDQSGGSSSNPVLGDVLAVVGAITASGYLLIGRELRKRWALLPYIWLVYTTAAVVLVLWMLLVGQRLWSLPIHVYGLIFLLAVGPQLLGHTSFNWALGYLSATFVTVAILAEPVGSALLALAFLPNQQLQPLQIIGGLLLLGGIAAVSLAERKNST